MVHNSWCRYKTLSREELPSGTEDDVVEDLLDDWPHLFKDANSLGYVTAYAEDTPRYELVAS
jgi:hypothetical protein